ncbi:MAG: KOW domain-containing RNA-binding protein [Clostridia bacterium]|nr:KOW domain-containing RNA-binding protein [Clostridia bacterium]
MIDPRGQIVESTAGRDKTRYFVIVGVCDEAHVYIVDGVTHKACRPKKKKLKHLRFCGKQLDMDKELEGGAGTLDAYVRKGLAAILRQSEI